MKNTANKQRVICPQTSYYNVELILITLYKNKLQNEEELAKQASEISGKKISKSVVTNVLPITNKMELTYKISKKANKNIPLSEGIYLSTNGGKLVEAIKQENKKKIREIAYEGVKKSTILNFAYKFIKENEEISYEDLGERIEKESNKNWKNPSTKKHVARTCIKLLQGFHIIEDIKIKGINKGRTKRYDGLSLPLSANKIFKFVKNLNYNEFKDLTWDLQDKRRNERILSSLSYLQELGLVKRNNKQFKLSDLGKKLQDVLDTPEESRVFREILLNYKPAKNFITYLAKNNKSFKRMDVGWKINEFNQSDWTKYTARSQGSKFLNCMKRANIAIENSERGKYRMNFSVLNKIDKIDDKNEKNVDNESKKLSEVIIPKEKTLSVNGNINEYLEKSKFEDILYNILLNYNWESEKSLRKELEDEIKKAKNACNKYDNQIIIDSILLWIEKAYEEKDRSDLRNAGRLYKQFMRESKR